MMIARYIAVNDVTESNPLESEIFSLFLSPHLEQIDTNFIRLAIIIIIRIDSLSLAKVCPIWIGRSIRIDYVTYTVLWSPFAVSDYRHHRRPIVSCGIHGYATQSFLMCHCCYQDCPL